MVVDTEFQPTRMDVARHNRVLDSMEYVELETAARKLIELVKEGLWREFPGCDCDQCVSVRKLDAVLAANKPWVWKPEGEAK